MLGGEARSVALAVLFAGCAFGDAGQSTGGMAEPSSGGASSSSASAGGAASGGAAGAGGLGGGVTSSVSSAVGGAAGAGGVGGAGGGGGPVPCADSADCQGGTCCEKFRGARPVATCVLTPADCDPEDGGTILCDGPDECLNADDVCCISGKCGGLGSCQPKP